MRIQAEANLSALIESTEDLIWSVDPCLRLINFNSAFKRHFVLNFGGPVAPGMGLRELIPPERAVVWPPLYERALKGEKFRAEITLVDQRILDLSFSPILVDGKTTGVSVFGKDVTEARAAEKRYKDIFEGALEGFFQTSPEGGLLITNRAMARMLDYESPAEMMACITDTAHQLWVDEEERIRVIRQIEENRFIQDYECRFKRKDGAPIWVLLNCRCVRNALGQVVLFEGSIQDITKRRRAEDELKKAEANLSALIESTHDLIWAVDLEYRKVVFNRALKKNLEENFGSRVEPGMRAEETLPPERAALWKPLYDRALHEGPYRTEYSLVDGRTLELSLNPILVDGKAVGVSVFGKDITERLRSEAQLRESEARFRNLFEQNGSVMILVAPESGLIVAANLAASRFYGYSREELTGMNVDQINTLPAEEIARERQKALSEERNFFSFRHRLASGELRDVEVYSSPVEAVGRRLLFSIVHDVTEREQAQIELRESRDFLIEAQRIGDLGCYVLDFSSGFWSSTPQLDEVFGIGAGYERSVAGWAELVHPDDRARMTEYFENEVCGTGKDFDKEYRIERVSDRAERWVHGMGRLEFDAEGRPAKMRGIIRDITEHKQTEIAVEEREKLFRAITESSPLAYAITSSKQEERIDYLNPSFIRLFGYAREELPTVADWWARAYPDPEYGAWVMTEWQRKIPRSFASDSAMEPIETEVVCKDGSKKNVLWGFVRIGELNLAYGLDITEQKRATQALRESETRYRTVFQTSIDAISITCQKEGRIVDVNQEYLRMFGFEREELIGRTTREINVWTDLADRLKLVEALKNQPFIREMEFLLQKKSGEKFWVSVSGSQLDLDGVPCYMIVLRDTTASRAVAMALRDSEERYRATFEQAPVGIIHTALDGRFLRCNERFAEITGYRREEILDLSFQQITAPEFLEAALQARDQLLTQKSGIIRIEKQYIRKDGSRVWVRLSLTPRTDRKGRVAYYIVIVEDIQARKDSEARLAEAADALKKSELRYRMAFQTSIDAININRSSDGLFVDCNQAFLNILGYEREEVIGKSSVELNIWADLRDRQAMVELIRQNSQCRGLEVQFKRKTGETVWGEMSASLIEIDGAECILTVTRDISHEKITETTIRNLAFYDSLTCLPNRRYLAEKLSQILVAGPVSHSRALLFVELDHFKTLNETLGHLTGDLLLKEIAQRISACGGETDIVCRLGGDEFGMMLDDLSESVEEAAAQAQDVGERIRSSIGAPCLLDGRECITTASIGCTVFGSGPQSTDELMQEADIALYQAKLAGRNSLRFFSPALQSAVNARATLEEDLRQAIKGQQFLLYYQPQVLRGRLIGAEALIRWEHPRNGMVPPDEFIPLAEETGLILPVGEWVLDAACRQIAAWANRKEAAHLTVAVNISALQFRQLGFVETVLEALKRTGANPKNLKLELTESMLVENIEDVISKMTVLKAHGISFSLDDFGTGYSSLAYLKRLPLDQLKIDRAFVRDMLVDMTSGAIAQTVISLGRAMGLSVIAEGVENEEQRGFLAGLGCHAFQGMLFSPPLPLEEFEAYL
jgi:diguanylate cyclase (GGDEF)-like protein/PAS domain S-box-containing protein